ncbi:InlB B-repeat-containing protein [Enterococcus sp. DIV0800]|uniref:InlB B-repeat-containing protein n=1 Tax=unclassified Enterococcus TaxID=2608891 RepID=UPI003D2FBC86
MKKKVLGSAATLFAVTSLGLVMQMDAEASEITTQEAIEQPVQPTEEGENEKEQRVSSSEQIEEVETSEESIDSFILDQEKPVTQEPLGELGTSVITQEDVSDQSVQATEDNVTEPEQFENSPIDTVQMREEVQGLKETVSQTKENSLASRETKNFEQEDADKELPENEEVTETSESKIEKIKNKDSAEPDPQQAVAASAPIADDLTQQGNIAGVALEATNFPDANFRRFISQYDTNSDGFLSDDEISKIIVLSTPANVQNMEGIKYFTSLERLDVYNNKNITNIDVSGLTNLVTIKYSGNRNLKTLDFRNCPNLVVAYHSIQQETVYISAGMTSFIGCDLVRRHTGNVVIDLDGFYTINTDGSKSVDLTKVLSSELIKVFERNDQPEYDPVTKILVIPKNEVKSVYVAGIDNDGNDTDWTFYTTLNQVDDITIMYDSNGGSLVEGQVLEIGTKVTAPIDPVREGFTFKGWYIDNTLTELFDFGIPLSEDKVVYAKWEENEAPVTEKYPVDFESNGGTFVETQNVEKGKIAMEPTAPVKEGSTFKGWYTDESLNTVYDFTTAVTEAIILYAKWEKNEAPVAENYPVDFESNGGSSIDSQSVEKGKTAVEPEAPIKEGSTFKGWYTDESLNTAYDFTTAVTEAITLYAKWEENEAPITNDGKATMTLTNSDENAATGAHKATKSNNLGNNSILSKSKGTAIKKLSSTGGETIGKELPKTGSESNSWFTALGSTLLGLMGLFYWNRDRKKRGKHAK